MQMKSIDGIKKTKIRDWSRPVKVVVHSYTITETLVQARPQPNPVRVWQRYNILPYIKQGAEYLSCKLSAYQPKQLQEFFAGAQLWLKRMTAGQRRVPVYAVIVFVLLAFGSGAWSVMVTPKSEAESAAAVPPAAMPLDSSVPLGPISNVSNDVLFNMTIGQLETYLNALADENQKAKAAETMAARKEKLKAYLQQKKTPFASVSDTIAEQKHWKLILAISFAESTFGKNCVDNNCSNIGVKPGHPYWRKYATLADWVKDFNSLLERKYKDYTLEQMNGVYVQPKNPNWLLATRQILQELEEQGIE